MKWREGAAPVRTKTVTSQTNLNNTPGWEISGTGESLVLASKISDVDHYFRSSKDPVNSTTSLTEDAMKIRRKRSEEAEEALAGGLSKANIFMSF